MTISDKRRNSIKKGRESNKRRNIIKKGRESNKRRNIIKKRRESKEYDVTFKIVILGDNSAPKTSVVYRYISGYFRKDFKRTLGVDFCSKTTLFNGKKVKLQFWDFGGEERFRFLLSQYSKGANGAIFLYDISNRATFIHLRDCYQLFRESAGNVPIILAGASLGLEEDRIITSDEGLEAVKKYNLDGFIEVSPKTGKNIEELFNAIIRLALQTRSVKKKVKPKISLHHEKKQRNIEKEDDKRLSLEKKEENKRIVLKEGNVKKRLEDLAVKLNDLGGDLEKLKITWNSFIESIDEYNKAKFKDNYLIPYAHYLESKLRLLYPRVYERIDDKVDIKYIHYLERRFFPRKIFKVNDFLTLKLEHNSTFIYIKGKKFIQCIRLSLQIPPETRHLYEEIESIDEAAEVYKQSLFANRIVEGPMARPSRFQNRSITSEQEFWGHCSNIQAWVEHDYDTRLLHSNLSFPLLKALSDAGDPKAKAIFQEEIAIRLESGYPSVVNYLLEQRYLRYLDKDRLKILLENYTDDDQEMYCGNCSTELPDQNQQVCPNCGIPLKYLNMIDSLKKSSEIIAGAAIKGRQIIYTTDNWDISRDVDKLLSSWAGQKARFIMISGVKYSILQTETERLVAISLKGEGSILAARDDDYIIILQVKMKKNRMSGDIQDAKKALRNRIKKSLINTINNIDSRLAKTPSADKNIAIDPQLKGEIQAFLDWVKDPVGIAGYISYYLQQNDLNVISKLSKIYKELKQIFGV